MTADQIIIFAILGLSLVFFMWGRWRYDIVAFGALMLVVLLGLVPAEGAFVGFGHPAHVPRDMVETPCATRAKSRQAQSVKLLISE